LSRRGPNCGVSRPRPVGADGHRLNIRGRARNLVRRNGTRAAHSASDRAEEVALQAVGGHRNTGSVPVADQHAGLDGVCCSLALVARVERRAGDVLAAEHRVARTVRVGVVAVVVSWVEGFGCRGRRGGGRCGSSGAASVRWRRVVRSRRAGCAASIRRRRVTGRDRAS
jgi:hypothetical protein